MSRIRMSTKWNDPICTVCCIVTDSPVLMACTLPSRPVRYLDWLETNVESRMFSMRILWRLANFAVGHGTVDAMVWQIWHESLVSLSRHCKTGSTFLGELHQLWISMTLCEFTLFDDTAFLLPGLLLYICLYKKVTINMALTCMIF